MKSYPTDLQFAEFITVFCDRYVHKDAGSPALLAITSNEALLLSKYLFAGIISWTPPAADGNGERADLGECLERCALRNVGRTEMRVHATEEELKALGTFLVRGLVGVFLVLEQACVGIKPAGTKYAGQ